MEEEVYENGGDLVREMKEMTDDSMERRGR